MADQAEKLRQLALNLKKQAEAELREKDPRFNRTRVIAVTSGKGGVGKTNFTINLALTLTKLGKKVLVFDADLGLANVDVVLGVTPKYTLYNLIKDEMNIRDIITTGPGGLGIIAGGSGIQELANISRKKLNTFIKSLQELEGMADILLIDTGAGLNRNVLAFVQAADEVIVVCTPEPTSITDAYGLIKALHSKKPDARISLVVNRVENMEEGKNTANKLTMVSQRFLKLNLEQLGFIWDDLHVSKAVKYQEPFVLKYPNCLASTCMKGIADKLLTGQDTQKPPGGVKSFFNKIIGFFS
ncbi:flagellar biosynthesis protein FlhG [Carboxydocella sporoproducens DSM 16521]|uniref:Flagellar biosynthesis protein FlhG n=2 Tax=Carboxydocella TaxID=178898 RepID=A0A1T4P9I1_9FIRM|nr:MULTISPECIES: MinD/ParA family protein [Carboxydocella]AVX20751.1 flagellar biosynthesis protein FlhG [Carboxydocella thermautotrophica]AVX31170.1 flagellar biosynthesis protein FlhG [Carboxydocella thermautotrophica]GAW28280.1 chromosome partitioning protein ParA [Carboxydocella sp. ULO1]SJZ88031.1 flagellar biosynthesis protein FlhG [Carboxydocella sporoproducens DSM 16521]